MVHFASIASRYLLGATLILLPIIAYAANRSAVSSDGNLQANLVVLGRGVENGNGAEALVLIDKRRGTRKTLVVAKYDDDHTRNLTDLSDPIFSLDNGFIYINSSDASPYRSAVHQISISTGVVRFVTGEWVLSVIRNGPYRGFLIVQKHLIRDQGRNGTYNPVFVIRPDGHKEFMIREATMMMASWPSRRG